VIINNLNLDGITILKAKTDAPLVIDADAMLPKAVMLERLQVVGWRQAQILKAGGCIQLCESHGCALENVSREATRLAAGVEAFRLGIRK
jgi:hypothetical protein